AATGTAVAAGLRYPQVPFAARRSAGDAAHEQDPAAGGEADRLLRDRRPAAPAADPAAGDAEDDRLELRLGQPSRDAELSGFHARGRVADAGAGQVDQRPEGPGHGSFPDAAAA